MTTLRIPFPQLYTETRETWLAAGESACAQGDLKTARRYAVRVLARDPHCIEALPPSGKRDVLSGAHHACGRRRGVGGPGLACWWC